MCQASCLQDLKGVGQGRSESTIFLVGHHPRLLSPVPPMSKSGQGVFLRMALPSRGMCGLVGVCPSHAGGAGNECSISQHDSLCIDDVLSLVTHEGFCL